MRKIWKQSFSPYGAESIVVPILRPYGNCMETTLRAFTTTFYSSLWSDLNPLWLYCSARFFHPPRTTVHDRPAAQQLDGGTGLGGCSPHCRCLRDAGSRSCPEEGGHGEQCPSHAAYPSAHQQLHCQAAHLDQGRELVRV